jgi:5-(carboxyamino)imidazole ribonucleotide mutase
MCAALIASINKYSPLFFTAYVQIYEYWQPWGFFLKTVIFCFTILVQIIPAWSVFKEDYMKKVAVVMGSDSDFPVVKRALLELKRFGVPFEVRVISAHRTPREAEEFSARALESGFGVIIAAAGKAAHLAGVLAAGTTLPVIGLPIKSSCMDGLDSLFSTVQMPKGVPVATVAIDGAENAGLLAVQILAVSDPALAEKLAEYKEQMAREVREKDKKIMAEAENI